MVDFNRLVILKAHSFIPALCLGAAVVLAAAILVFTHLPNENVPQLITGIGDDKFRHVVSYGLFSALLFAAVRSWQPNPAKALAWVVAIGTAFAVVDELTQPLTGRTCSWLDWLASFGGTIMGACLMLSMALFRGIWSNSKVVTAASIPSTGRKE